VSRNKIFRCAYLSMHFRIKFLLFNDFSSYLCVARVSFCEVFLYCVFTELQGIFA
jgi:hypothetical protein